MRVLIVRSRALLASVAVVAVVSGFSRTVIGQQPATGAWPQFRGSPPLSGVASSTLAPSLKVVWTFDVGEAIESSAAIVDGSVYVGSAAGELIALDLQTGAVRWRYKTGEIGESSPAVANGAVYIGDLTGTFHAVDAKTGKALWTFKTTGEIRSSPVVVGDRVLIAAYDRFLYALSCRERGSGVERRISGYVHAPRRLFDGVATSPDVTRPSAGFVSQWAEVLNVPIVLHGGLGRPGRRRRVCRHIREEVIGIDMKARKSDVDLPSSR